METFTILPNDLKDDAKDAFLKFLEVEDEKLSEINIMIEKLPDGRLSCCLII